MRITVGNTHICEKIEDLDFKKLTPGNQVIMFERTKNNEEVNIETDCTSHMILSTIKQNCIYCFTTINLEPHISLEEVQSENEEEELRHYVTYADFSASKETERSYLFFPEGKIFPIVIDSHYSYGLNPRKIDFDMQVDLTGCVDEYDRDNKLGKFKENNILKYLHENIFKYSGNFYDRFGKTTESRSIIFYYSYPMDGDSSLVLTIEHNIRVPDRFWDVRENVMILNRDGSYINLECEFDDLYFMMNSLEDKRSCLHDEWKNFIHAYECSHYDINNYLADNGRKFFDVQILLESVSYSINLSGLESFYKPYYTSKDIDYKAYISTVFNHYGRSGWFYHYKGKGLNSWEIDKQEEANEINTENKIAMQLAVFVSNNYKGFNPKEGLYYNTKDKEDTEMNRKILYKDHGGIIFTSSEWNNPEGYYIKIKDYYVKADKNKDTQEIEELKARRDLTKKLSEGPQLTAI